MESGVTTVLTVIIGLCGIGLILVGIHLLEGGTGEDHEDKGGFHYGREPVLRREKGGR